MCVCRQAVWLRSRHSHRPWLSDTTAAPDDTLLPPGFGELRLTAGSLVLWGGTDSRAECAAPRCSHAVLPRGTVMLATLSARRSTS